jgi:hypothetical protein
VVLKHLNGNKEQGRADIGKSPKLQDASMKAHYEPLGGERAGEHAFDRTDCENDEFIYIY